MRKRRHAWLAAQATLGLLLLALPGLADAPAAATAGDVLDFCTASLPADALKKAEGLGWHPVEHDIVEKLRPLMEAPGDRPKDIQGWQRGSAAEADILVYAYDPEAGDGSFMAMLKSFAHRGHACLYLASANAAALTETITQRLGAIPTGDAAQAATGQVSNWETSSMIATVRDISQTQPPYTVALKMISK